MFNITLPQVKVLSIATDEPKIRPDYFGHQKDTTYWREKKQHYVVKDSAS